MREAATTKWMQAILYLLCFFLLLEWLIPVIELTQSDYIELFLFFIAISFLFPLFGVKWWVTIPVKIVYLFWVIHYIFYDQMLFSMQSIELLLVDLLSNASTLLKGEWHMITNPFRTFLFFSLLWMATYLLRYWIEVRKGLLVFYFITIVFVAFLDTFSVYKAGLSIYRILAIGFLLIGIQFVRHLLEQQQQSFSLRRFLHLIFPLILMIGISISLAATLPKQPSQWPDPVPFLKSFVSKNEGLTQMRAKSGYDEDDSVLGGPFGQDHSVVFEAKTVQQHYWKIETKNTYTLRGWEQQSTSSIPTNHFPGAQFPESNRSELVEHETSSVVEVSMKAPLPYLVYPYGMTSFETEKDVLFHYASESGQVWATSKGNNFPLKDYAITITNPSYSLKALHQQKMDDYAAEYAELQEYLQLPPELPQRVRNLAASITKNSTSIYEKAKAIEQYFDTNDFSYDQQDVPVPEPGQDYVDQFLFETKRGYCDNFSTSMVVMLRAVNIPARWAKGFAPGEIVTNEEGERMVQITNNEAHSWVEVYIPNFGWLPFEPTIGFTNPTEITYDDVQPAREDALQQQQEKQSINRDEPVQSKENEAPATTPSQYAPFHQWLREQGWLIILASSVLLLLFLALFKWKSKWWPFVAVRMFRTKQSSWETFSKQYHLLLQQLARVGLQRQQQQTLAEYAIQVDRYYGTAHMRLLTEAYELGLYGRITDQQDWSLLQEKWEHLIIRTAS